MNGAPSGAPFFSAHRGGGMSPPFGRRLLLPGVCVTAALRAAFPMAVGFPSVDGSVDGPPPLRHQNEALPYYIGICFAATGNRSNGPALSMKSSHFDALSQPETCL